MNKKYILYILYIYDLDGSMVPWFHGSMGSMVPKFSH